MKPLRLQLLTKDTAGFTIIEIIIAVTVLSGLIIAGFAAFGDISKLKIRALTGVDIYEQVTISSNTFFNTIKESGTIDYEEYFNRSVVGTGTVSGHYSAWSGYGNEGDIYLCRSGSGTAQKMGSDGCYGSGTLVSSGGLQIGKTQRYGSYKNQFIDYNTNASSDGGEPGDQNRDGNIRGDDDDEDIGKGPPAFSGSVKELYLIKQTPNGAVRNYFRLTYERDPFAPTIASCDISNGTGTGCIGRLQMLKLEGRDYGPTHGIPSYQFDGVIDTWVCAQGYFCSGATGNSAEFMPTMSGSGTEWVSLFTDDINVESIEFLPSPKHKTQFAWKDTTLFEQNPNVHITMRIGYGWKKRRLLQTQATPSITLSTTVNLYD